MNFVLNPTLWTFASYPLASNTLYTVLVSIVLGETPVAENMRRSSGIDSRRHPARKHTVSLFSFARPVSDSSVQFSCLDWYSSPFSSVLVFRSCCKSISLRRCLSKPILHFWHYPATSRSVLGTCSWWNPLLAHHPSGSVMPFAHVCRISVKFTIKLVLGRPFLDPSWHFVASRTGRTCELSPAFCHKNDKSGPLSTSLFFNDGHSWSTDVVASRCR